ncbi:hypothetical protein [Kushneria aurantia]|uniref:Glycosyltransferase family 2 protein n=1 Tax=Kushneria aurantia TaxID=504092 RepID=A0ABV6FZK5_9GAMM|nr:hypothetical protein [Kushneria aurantia]
MTNILSARKKRKLLTRILSPRMAIRNRLARRGLETNRRLVVSMTTHPPRIHEVYIALESIMAQEINDFTLRLYISASDMTRIGQLPATLHRLVRRGLEIVITAQDYRSYDKLVHALADSPEATIVTADDDVIYPRRWLSELLAGARRHPGCIICHRGHLLSESPPGSGRISYGASRAAGADAAQEPALALMPTGNSGVLYPPGSLDPMAQDSDSFLRLAPSADDIWFKLASLKRGTRCYRLGERNAEFPPTRSARLAPLHRENVAGGGNDRQLADCLAHFPELARKLFDELTADRSTLLQEEKP